MSMSTLGLPHRRTSWLGILGMLALLLPQAASGHSPPIPSWGGALQYRVHVNLTAHDVVKEGATWEFQYAFLSSQTMNVSRYDHLQGQRDEVCNSIKSGSNEPCTAIHASDGWLYVAFPNSGSCCKCSQHIGPVRSDWLQDGGASYQGSSEVRGYKVDEWLKQGASDNHYYCTSDAAQKPVRYMEHKNNMLKQWDFDLSTYIAGPIPEADSFFSPPASCTSRCRVAMCLF